MTEANFIVVSRNLCLLPLNLSKAEEHLGLERFISF
jgi:hypothetical protein